MQKMEKLHIFKRLFDFSKWLLNHTGKFPKSHRFSVAVKMENSALEMLELITKANMRRQKMKLLIEADEKLLYLKIMSRFRIRCRLSTDSRTRFELNRFPPAARA